MLIFAQRKVGVFIFFVTLTNSVCERDYNVCCPRGGTQQYIVCVSFDCRVLAVAAGRNKDSQPPFHADNTVELMAAFDQDSYQWREGGRKGGIVGVLCVRTQNPLEGLLIPAGLETPRDPPRRSLEDVAGAAQLSLLPPQLGAARAGQKRNERIDCQEPQKAQRVCWNGVRLTGAARIYGHTNTTLQRNRYRHCKRRFPVNACSSRSFIWCHVCLFRVVLTFRAPLPLIPVQHKHRVVVFVLFFFISACLCFAFHLCIRSPSPVPGS